jgi:hypothetical protein
MRQKSVPEKEPATEVVKRSVARRGDTSRRKTRSALRGEDSIAELCGREGILQNLRPRFLRSAGGSDALKAV